MVHFPRKPTGLLITLLLGDALLVCGYILSQALGWWRSTRGLVWKLATLLDVQSAGSLPAWYLSSQLFLVSFLLALHLLGRDERERGGGRLFAVLPLAFAALSFDAMADLHIWVTAKAPKLLAPGLLYPAGFLSGNLFALGMALLILLTAGLSYILDRRRDALRPFALRFLGALAVWLLGSLTFGAHGGAVALEATGLAIARLFGATALVWAASALPSAAERTAIAARDEAWAP